jgi:DNA-binding response OmpR family regulator
VPEEAKKLILVVDDEPRMIQFIRMNLELEGYRVTQASNGLEALDQVRDELPDLVVLDVMMPELDGFETLRMLREVSSVPVIMLTVKADEEDKVKGLGLGADDYVTKPFSPRELVLRVRKLLERGKREPAKREKFVFGELVIDIPHHLVSFRGKRIDLTATEFRLLVLLVERAGRVQSRDQLLTDVWKYDNVIDTRTVDTHMRRLREKLGPAAKHLDTVRGVGYRFVE